VAGEPLQDIHILDNTISQFHFSAIAVPYAGAEGDVHNIEINGNQIVTSSDTCFPAVEIGYRASSQGFSNILVTDNSLTTMNDGVQVTYLLSGTVTDNVIIKRVNSADCGLPPSLPVRVTNSGSLLVKGNTARGFGG